jgi:septal ring factor EnvC (AmiA/AmiB activator)
MKWHGASRFLVLLALGVAAFGAVTALPAQELADQRRALKAARDAAAIAEQRRDRLQQEAQSAANAASRTAAQVAAIAADIAAAQANIDAAEARIAIIAELQRQQTYRLAEQQGPLVRLTAILQKIARRPPALALLESESLSEIVHVRAALRHVLPAVQARTRALRAEVARSRQLRAQAAQAQAALVSSQQALAQRRSELAQREAEQRGDARRLRAGAQREGDRVLALGEDVRDILDAMDVERDAGQTAARLAVLPGPELDAQRATATRRPVKAAASPAYVLPVAGALRSGLGEGSNSGYRARGLTLAAAAGSAVRAPAAGRIVYAGRYRGFGMIVIIEHDRRWNSLIANMADVRVSKGEQVAQGALIGAAAPTGSDIIVELRRNNRPIDILALIG